MANVQFTDTKHRTRNRPHLTPPLRSSCLLLKISPKIRTASYIFKLVAALARSGTSVAAKSHSSAAVTIKAAITLGCDVFGDKFRNAETSRSDGESFAFATDVGFVQKAKHFVAIL